MKLAHYDHIVYLVGLHIYYVTLFFNYSEDGGSQHLRKADISIAACMASYSIFLEGLRF